MDATKVEIPYSCGRGAAKSKLEQYLVEKGFKQKMIKRRGIVWRQDIKNSEFIKCFEVDFDDGKFTLSAFLAGTKRNGQYMEEDLSGMERIISKQQMRKHIKEIKELYE